MSLPKPRRVARARTILLAAALLSLLAPPAVGRAPQDGKADGQMPAARIPPAAGEAGQADQPRLYSSTEDGVEVLLPPGEPAAAESDDVNVLAVVVNKERNWRFELIRLPLEQPLALKPEELPEGGRRPGLFSLIVDRAQADLNGHLLRQDITPLGSADGATYAMYYQVGRVGQLRQAALLRATDTLYFQIRMTSTAPADAVPEGTLPKPGEVNAALAGALAQDPEVRAAVAAFRASMESFKLLDQTALRQDQDERLLRTRAMFLNLTKSALLAAAEPEQYWRIVKDGKDVGYSYVVEEPARDIPADPRQREQVDAAGARGVRVGVRTRLRRGEGWLDRQTWLYAGLESDDPDAQVNGFKVEEFRERNWYSVDGQRKADNLVVGTMRGRRVPQKVRIPRPGGLGFQDAMDLVDARKLDVTFVVNGQQAEPLARQLPAWYLPAAVDHLLPRIVARWGEKTYLVAVYNPEKREVFQQYVDVGPLAQETVNGQRRTVRAVTTRMGLGGKPVRHFVDPETYAWLGSVDEGAGVSVWPTDRQTLQQIWSNPELTAPDARQGDHPAPPPAAAADPGR